MDWNTHLRHHCSNSHRCQTTMAFGQRWFYINESLFTRAIFCFLVGVMTLGGKLKRTYINKWRHPFSHFCRVQWGVPTGVHRGFMVGNSKYLWDTVFLLLVLFSIILLYNVLYTGKKPRLAPCKLEQRRRCGKEKKWPEILKKIEA